MEKLYTVKTERLLLSLSVCKNSLQMVSITVINKASLFSQLALVTKITQAAVSQLLTHIVFVTRTELHIASLILCYAVSRENRNLLRHFAATGQICVRLCA